MSTLVHIHYNLYEKLNISLKRRNPKILHPPDGVSVNTSKFIIAMLHC